MTQAGADPPSFRRRYPLRLLKLSLLVIALLPMTILSIGQGLTRMERERAWTRDRMSEQVMAASQSERKLLEETAATLQGVAQLDEFLPTDAAVCHTKLRQIAAKFPYIANISIATPGGVIRCSAMDQALGVDVTHQGWWSQVNWAGGFQISLPMIGTIIKKPLLLALLPQLEADGRRSGLILAALDLEALRTRLSPGKTDNAGVAVLLDAGRRAILSSQQVVLPRFENHALPAPGELAVADAPDGTGWTYAVAPLVSDTLYIAYAVPDGGLFSGSALHVGTDFALPLIALLFASAAIWLGTERWVMSGLRDIRRVIRAYAGGNYDARVHPATSDVAEIVSVIEGLHRMAAMAHERDRRLHALVEQKEMLVLEVNHRVKNNLQIVMSLLSIQMSRLRNPEARHALDQARMRIAALAIVHRTLLEIGRVNAVDCRMLLSELCEQLRVGYHLAARDIDLSLDCDPLDLPTDLASPLALFAVEAITNALVHGMAVDMRNGRVEVALLTGAGSAALTIRDNGSGFTPDNGNSGTGSSLLRAFAQQLKGEMTIESQPGGPTLVTITFPLPLLKPEEPFSL